MFSRFKNIKIESIVKEPSNEFNNLTPKQLLILINKWEEWSNDSRHYQAENYHSVYKKRKLICNTFKDILVLNSENYDRLNKRNKIRTNNRLVFHGGCLGCDSQLNYGIKNCNGCQYFKADWNKPSLFNVPPSKKDAVIINISKEEHVSLAFAQASKNIIYKEKSEIFKIKKSTLRPAVSISKSCFLLKL